LKFKVKNKKEYNCEAKKKKKKKKKKKNKENKSNFLSLKNKIKKLSI